MFSAVVLSQSTVS